MSSRKREKHTLAEALQEFISENRLQEGINKVSAGEAWQKIMGNGVNNYTISVELRGKTLFVSLSSSVLREELSLGRSKIKAMLNEELGKELIEKIVLK